MQISLHHHNDYHDPDQQDWNGHDVRPPSNRQVGMISRALPCLGIAADMHIELSPVASNVAGFVKKRINGMRFIAYCVDKILDRNSHDI